MTTKVSLWGGDYVDLDEWHAKQHDPQFPSLTEPSKALEAYIPGLGTVRECIDCGCLVAGGPTRCKRCVRELEDRKHREQFEGCSGDHDERVDIQLEMALRPLLAIADAYDANGLDPPARKTWGVHDEYKNEELLCDIILYSGRGGRTLLTLADCMRARDVINYTLNRRGVK